MTSLSSDHGSFTPQSLDLSNILSRRRSHALRHATALLGRQRRVGIVIADAADHELSAQIPKAVAILAPQQSAAEFDVVLADFTHSYSPAWAGFLSRAAMAGCEVRHAADYLECHDGRVSLDHFSSEHIPQQNGCFYPCMKRALDVALVVCAAPLAAILGSAGAIGVLATMGRPIFFTQERVGANGKTFRMYKLRTMRNAAKQEAASATSINDARITPLGALLRRYRIDELPQFWNILRGDMSLIGPRPEQPKLTADYVQQLPAFQARLLVRPGISGWAQVKAGYASDLAETKIKLSYDLFYVKHSSLALDFEIAVRTIRTLVCGERVR